MHFRIIIFVLVLCLYPPFAELFSANEYEQSVDPSSSIRSLQKHRENISRLESQHGAYHVELGDALRNLGQWYQSQGYYLKAVEALDRALHISKVNKGMHNLVQVELIELLVESYSALQDWKGLENKLHYLLWIYRRNYTSEDDRLVSMMERVGQWYMKAYQLHRGGEAVSYLVKADDLFDEAAGIIVSQNGEQSRQLVNVLHSTATINYQIANDVNDIFKMSHRDIREAMISNKRGSPYMNEVAVRAYYFDQSFYKGRRSLNRVIDIYKNNLPESAVEYAQALVYQGDFYLALNRKWNAMSNYKKAYEILVEHEADSEDIVSIFGEPRRVEPFNIPGKELASIDQSRYIDAMFDVPSNGWPRDIRIIATRPEDNSELMIRGKHAVAATRYRPRFENGIPVNTERVSLRYVFRK